MFGIIAAALGLLGTLAGIAWKWKAANSASAADRAATAEARDANAATAQSAAVTDTVRTNVQEQTDANSKATAILVDRVGDNRVGLQSGADAINAAIAAADRPKD